MYFSLFLKVYVFLLVCCKIENFFDVYVYQNLIYLFYFFKGDIYQINICLGLEENIDLNDI